VRAPPRREALVAILTDAVTNDVWVDTTRRRVLKRLLGPERYHARYPEELRYSVGGLWDEMGQLQLEFLKGEGLQPGHDFLDVGCGLLRAGIPIMRYLEPGRYCGLDASEVILAGARAELRKAGVQDQQPTLLHTYHFEAHRLGRMFDYALAQSVFSHIPINAINVCLLQIAQVLKPGGRFYATFFENPAGTRTLGEVEHPAPEPQPTRTYPDQDPFHYGLDLFEWLIEGSDLELRYIGDWGQPRNQHMLLFVRR